MIYKNRPLFPFQVDWSEAVTARLQYDLRPAQIGYGPERLEPLQEHTAHAFTFTIDLHDGCAINRLERFLQSVQGRLRGWHLPGNSYELRLLRQHAPAQIDVDACGLAATWQDHPTRHLWLRSDDDTLSQAVEMAAVEAISETVERITLTADLEAGVDAGWSVQRLYLVRFGRDEVTLRHVREWSATVEIQAVELPLEYAATDLGERPQYLYEFGHTTAGTTERWYYTSHDVAVTHGGHTYEPAPFSHGRIQQTAAGTTDDVEIQSWRFTGNPLNMYFPFPPQRVLGCNIRELMVGAPASRVLFSGVVQTVGAEGQRLTAQCASLLAADKRRLPRQLVQKTCNYTLYQGGTCRVSAAAYKKSGTVSAVNGQQITVTASFGSHPAGYYALGYCVATNGDGAKEIRQIRQSAISGATCVLTLNARFDKVVVGDAIDVFPGCDLRAETCASKFGNLVNFGGHPFIDENLSLKAVKQKPTQGGAKK